MKKNKVTLLQIGTGVHFFDDYVKKLDKLKAGQVYRMQIGKSIWLEPQNDFDMPKKVYDFDKDFRNHVLKAFNSDLSDNNMVVLLEGFKGQGKSLQAKQIALESNLPIIMITSPISKDVDFISFLNKIQGDHVLFIDEFEKIFKAYDNREDPYHAQEVFLSYLSGVSFLHNKRLCIFTSNDKLNEKFHNRPGRIRYHKEYNFMCPQVFQDILDDKLANKDFEQDLIENINKSICTVDVLTSIIQEINIQDKPYSQFKEFFNFKESSNTYDLFKWIGNKWVFEKEEKLDGEISPDFAYTQRLIGHNSKIINAEKGILVYECETYEYLTELDQQLEKATTILTKYKLVKKPVFHINAI